MTLFSGPCCCRYLWDYFFSLSSKCNIFLLITRKQKRWSWFRLQLLLYALYDFGLHRTVNIHVASHLTLTIVASACYRVYSRGICEVINGSVIQPLFVILPVNSAFTFKSLYYKRFITYCCSQNIYLEMNIVLENDWIVTVKSDYFVPLFGKTEKITK